jgi:hypothetical protein
MPNRFFHIVQKLKQHGFDVLTDGDDLALVIDGDRQFALTSSREWLQIAQKLLDPAEIRNLPARSAIVELAIRSHAHFIGCRFGITAANQLEVLSDVFPGTSFETLLAMFDQVSCMGAILKPLFERAARGMVVSDAAIELAIEAA